MRKMFPYDDIILPIWALKHDVAEGATSRHLTSYRKAASFVQIMFTEFKGNPVLNFK